jgi:hypothetical protein
VSPPLTHRVAPSALAPRTPAPASPVSPHRRVAPAAPLRRPTNPHRTRLPPCRTRATPCPHPSPTSPPLAGRQAAKLTRRERVTRPRPTPTHVSHPRRTPTHLSHPPSRKPPTPPGVHARRDRAPPAGHSPPTPPGVHARRDRVPRSAGCGCGRAKGPVPVRGPLSRAARSLLPRAGARWVKGGPEGHRRRRRAAPLTQLAEARHWPGKRAAKGACRCRVRRPAKAAGPGRGAGRPKGCLRVSGAKAGQGCGTRSGRRVAQGVLAGVGCVGRPRLWDPAMCGRGAVAS